MAKEVRRLTPEELEIYNWYYHEYYKMIHRIAKHRVGDENIADVVTQETFITAWVRFDDFQSSGNPVGWLVIVARNKCKQALRDRQYYLNHRVFDRNVEEIPVEYDYSQIDPLVPEIEEKELLARFYGEGYTIQELADEQNVKLSAMKMRIKRARDKMKEIILQNN